MSVKDDAYLSRNTWKSDYNMGSNRKEAITQSTKPIQKIQQRLTTFAIVKLEEQ